MAQSKQCLRCGGTLVEGFVLDQSHGASTVPTWVEGSPERSIWTGVRLSGKPRHDIASWKCRSCGFIEHYAASGPSAHVQAQKRTERIAFVAAFTFLALIAGLGGVFALMSG